MSNDTAIKDYIEAQCDLSIAIKNATGFVNNDYADLNEVVRVVKEAFQARNFAINHIQFSNEHGDFLKTIFEHTSGKTWETSVRLLYKPNDMQSLGSAITYARRYGLSQLAASNQTKTLVVPSDITKALGTIELFLDTVKKKDEVDG